jgi:hypothetical protein
MKKKASSCSPFLILVIVILIPSMEASHAYYGYPAGGLAHAYNTPHAYYEAPHHEYHVSQVNATPCLSVFHH